MTIAALDPLDPNLALAAAQAARQLLALNYPSTQASEALLNTQDADTVSLSNMASSAANLITDPFAALMQQATSVTDASPAASQQAPSQTTDQSATAASTVVQAANQTQLLDTNSATSNSVLSPTLGLPDSQITLLQQAYLAPLATQVFTGPIAGASELADQVQRDVAATAALSPAGAFGNGQTSNPNPYTLVPDAAQVAMTPGFPGNGGAENYMLMQQLLAPASAMGSLDLLV